jgi:hypothetical protein
MFHIPFASSTRRARSHFVRSRQRQREASYSRQQHRHQPQLCSFEEARAVCFPIYELWLDLEDMESLIISGDSRRRSRGLGRGGRRWSARPRPRLALGLEGALGEAAASRVCPVRLLTASLLLFTPPAVSRTQCDGVQSQVGLCSVITSKASATPRKQGEVACPRCQIQGLFCPPWFLRRCSGVPKFSLWGARTGATCGARGMF